jgi:hypothetical protein
MEWDSEAEARAKNGATFRPALHQVIKSRAEREAKARELPRGDVRVARRA